MANTIDCDLVVLRDNWPNNGDIVRDIPQDGFAGSYTHNVSSTDRKIPIGTKCKVYNSGESVGVPGWSTLIYLMCGTQHADSVIAAKSICTHDSATLWHSVANDYSTARSMIAGRIAIAVAAITNSYFGWFWCGGVVPEQYVAALTGNLATDGSVVYTVGLSMAQMTGGGHTISLAVFAAGTAGTDCGIALADDA